MRQWKPLPNPTPHPTPTHPPTRTQTLPLRTLYVSVCRMAAHGKHGNELSGNELKQSAKIFKLYICTLRKREQWLVFFTKTHRYLSLRFSCGNILYIKVAIMIGKKTSESFFSSTSNAMFTEALHCKTDALFDFFGNRNPIFSVPENMTWGYVQKICFVLLQLLTV